MSTPKQIQTVYFPGEKEAVAEILQKASQYGYGNIIAHLKKAWAEYLIENWDMPTDIALMATNVSAYPLKEYPIKHGSANP